MALSIVSIINLIAPDLYADVNRDDWITLAKTRTAQCYFGGDYSLAVALRASHMWALINSRPSGESGVITSKKEGDLSISFGAGGGSSNDDLGLTTYGQQLKSLIKGIRPAISVLGPSQTITCEEE